MFAGHFYAEVFVGEAGGYAAAGGAVEEADLDEEGFVDLFEGVLLFGQGGGEGVEADGAAIVFFDDSAEQAAVELVEAVGVDFEEGEGSLGGCAVDATGGADFGEVADAAEEAVGDAGCAAGAHGDLGGAVAVDGDAEDFGGALDYPAEFVVGIELEAEKDAEAGAERRREQAGARGGSDEGEGVDAHDVGARRGAGADHDVELVVLECGVELFFHDGLEAVDLIEEEDLPGLEVGEDGGHVALDLEGGAAGLLEGDVELVGDDSREGGFTEAGGTEEKDVIEGFAAGLGGLKRDGELFLGFGLADEFGEALGAQLQLDEVIVVDAAGGDEALCFIASGRGATQANLSFLLEIHLRRG
jgi:hypothetical protein